MTAMLTNIEAEDPKIEPIVLLREISRAWKCDVRTVESGLRRNGVRIICLGPRKRAVLQRHYAMLLATGEVAA